jgi:hypothetical protein
MRTHARARGKKFQTEGQYNSCERHWNGWWLSMHSLLLDSIREWHYWSTSVLTWLLRDDRYRRRVLFNVANVYELCNSRSYKTICTVYTPCTNLHLSRYGDYATGSVTEESESDSNRGRSFLCSKAFISSPRTSQSPIPFAQGAPFKDMKRPWRDADHSPPSSEEVESERRYTAIPQYASIACIWTVLPYNLTLRSHNVTTGVIRDLCHLYRAYRMLSNTLYLFGF